MVAQDTPLKQQLLTLKDEAVSKIQAAQTLDDVEQFRVAYLGKKGELSIILKGMGKLGPDERPKVGAIANQVKEALQSALVAQKEDLQTALVTQELGRVTT